METVARRRDEDREDIILNETHLNGRVDVDMLAEAFGVSQVTIRKDLDRLASRGLVRRVRGGAVVANVGEEGFLTERLREHAAIKQAIARSVALMIEDGDVVVIDASSTCYYLALEVLDRKDLIVVTDGLKTASLLLEQSSATVIMPGGILRRASTSMVGTLSSEIAGRGRISKGFFGVAAISERFGLLGLSMEEAETKHSLVAECDHVYALFASSKASGFGLHPFASPTEIDGMFTDDAVAPEFIATWEARGVRVNTVPAPTSSALADRDLSIGINALKTV